MGGSSKSQTVGYKYYLGVHMALCHGPVDRIMRIRVGKKTAWMGDQQGSGQITIAAPNLFGGESREGGVSGAVDIAMGEPAQGQNSYLASKLGATIPNFRGVCAAILRQVYVGMNPYLKAWDFRLSRVHTRQNGVSQWYDAKVEINVNSSLPDQLGPTSGGWKYLIVPLSDETDRSAMAFDDSGWDVGQSPFASGASHPYSELSGFPAISNTYWPLNTKIWVRRRFNLKSNTTFGLVLFVDNYATVWINGTMVMERSGTNSAPSGPIFTHAITVPSNILFVGENVIAMMGEDYGSYTYAGFTVDFTGLLQYDMNPAHIIRECLTDPDWGMGYQDSDIDDASFMAAADALFAEEMGISLLWDRQIPLEDFIKEILKHIDAVLFVDRTSGRFVLQLIRANYDEGSLLILDESNVERVEDFKIPALGELINSVTVNHWDAITGNAASITVQDIALTQLQGATINTSIEYPGFTNGGIAARIAARDLRSLSTPLVSCTIYANRQASSLNVGDVFKLVWPDYGLAGLVMRVTHVAYGDGRSSRVRVTCTQDVFDLPDAVSANPSDEGWVDPVSTPQPCPRQVVVEAPYFEAVQRLGQDEIDAELAGHQERGYILVAGDRPSGTAINATVLIDAGAGYQDSAAMDFSPSAVLASAVGPSETAISLVDGIDLDLVGIGSHAQIGDEIVRIDAISDTTATIGRGCLDTVPASHAAGAALIAWDVYAASDNVEYASGETVSAKLLPVTGAGVLSASAAAAMSITMASRAHRPYPPGNFKIIGAAYPSLVQDVPLAFSWAHRDRTQQTSGQIVDTTAGNIGPEVGTTYTLQLWNHATSTLIQQWTGITSTSQSGPSLSGTFSLRAELWSVRDGVASFQKHVHIFVYSNTYYRITEGGDLRITEGGDLRITE